MGRGKKRSFRGKSRAGGGSREPWAGHPVRGEYKEVVKSNALFEAFYSNGETIPSDQVETFWATIRKDLPASFRFTGSKGHALIVQRRLIDHYIPEIAAVKFNNEFVEPPTQLPWYPEKLAWSMTTPKNVIRRFAPFASFQKFLVSETSVGNISRQEVVSMIPPLLLDVKPGMTVLDMCAAPGSKSAQLIEMVHAGEEMRTWKIAQEIAKHQQKEGSPIGLDVKLEDGVVAEAGDWSDDGRSTGLLIANDSSYQRAQMLIHQVKRLNSPNLLVTNHDASVFPSIKVSNKEGRTRYLKFDRILADVPCSGDGTARKNPNVWKDWMPSTGMGLHNLQVRILVRALQMLKVGGRAVYSTCSLNPVENEAVIAAAIDAVGGPTHVRIVDCSTALPELKRVCGLSKWSLMDRYERFYESWDDLKSAKADETTEHREVLEKFTKSMFAPPQKDDESQNLPLRNCMRIYPHLQDTGGFFITVLEKVSEIRAGTKSLAEPDPPAENSVYNGLPPQVIDANDKQDVRSETGQQVDSAQILPLEEETNPPLVLDSKSEEIMTGEKRKRDVDDVVAQDTAKKVRTTDLVNTSNGVEADRNLMIAKPKRNHALEEIYVYLDPDHAVLKQIVDFYTISPRFPRDRYMVRNISGEPAKAIYYTSELVRDILTLNEGKGIKFVQAGVKMFMRQDAQGRDICRWRIQSEGTPILDTWIGEDRVIRIYKKVTLRKLLVELFMKVGGPGWNDLGAAGPQLKDMPMGCCLVRIEPSEESDGFKERLVFPLWRSVSAINLMLPKEERKALLLRLFNDDTPLIDHNVLRMQDSKATEEFVEEQEDD